MHWQEPLGSLPLWAVFLGTLLVVLLAVEGGYLWAKHRVARAGQDGEHEKEAPVGAMVGAVLGLLALLLAFSFGKAADHFHARKVALLEEANAIRTTYLQAALLGEPQSTEIRSVLREFVAEG